MDVWAPLLLSTRHLCLGWPEVDEVEAWVGTRWSVRRRTFAHLVPVIDGWPPIYARALGSSGPAVMLTFRTPEPGPYLHAEPDGPRRYIGAGRDLVALVVDGTTDWDDAAEAIGDSYRLMAPRALAARLNDPHREH